MSTAMSPSASGSGEGAMNKYQRHIAVIEAIASGADPESRKKAVDAVNFFESLYLFQQHAVKQFEQALTAKFAATAESSSLPRIERKGMKSTFFPASELASVEETRLLRTENEKLKLEKAMLTNAIKEEASDEALATLRKDTALSKAAVVYLNNQLEALKAEKVAAECKSALLDKTCMQFKVEPVAIDSDWLEVVSAYPGVMCAMHGNYTVPHKELPNHVAGMVSESIAMAQEIIDLHKENQVLNAQVEMLLMSDSSSTKSAPMSSSEKKCTKKMPYDAKAELQGKLAKADSLIAQLKLQTAGQGRKIADLEAKLRAVETKVEVKVKTKEPKDLKKQIEELQKELRAWQEECLRLSGDVLELPAQGGKYRSALITQLYGKTEIPDELFSLMKSLALES